MKKLLFVLPISILLAAGCNSTTSEQAAITNQTTQSPTTTQDSSAMDIPNAKATVLTFMANIGYNHGNNNLAVEQLTSNAQSSASSTSGLANFLHTQEPPDNGITITDAKKENDGSIKVNTQWNYSGGSPIIKTFTLIQENSQWKIDKVQ